MHRFRLLSRGCSAAALVMVGATMAATVSLSGTATAGVVEQGGVRSGSSHRVAVDVDRVAPEGPASRPVSVFGDAPEAARKVPWTIKYTPKVYTGQRPKWTGSVVVWRSHPRVLVLQQRQAGKWHRAGATKSTARGKYTLKGPKFSKVGERTFRVIVPATKQLGKMYTGAHTVTVIVNPYALGDPAPVGPLEVPVGDWDAAEFPNPTDPAAVGKASDWTWLFGDDSKARWNPCETIGWVYNPEGGYDGARAHMKRAVARLAGVTGLHFKYLGDTTFKAAQSPVKDWPEGASIVIGWANAKHVSQLKGSVVGVAFTNAKGLPDGYDVSSEITSVEIVFDKGEKLLRGFTLNGGATWGQVMEHEAMHGLGLGHANGAVEVMAPAVSTKNHQFGLGDLAGMVRVGASKGCLE